MNIDRRRVSVVVPTYNGSAYIQEALDSVFRQSVPPDEILVSDDCSHDNTLEIVGSLSRDSPVPIRVLESDRNSGGPGRPLNAGIRAAAGEFIAVLEQDDLMKPRRIEKQLEALNRFPEGQICIGRFEVKNCDNSELPTCYDARRQFEHFGFPDQAATPNTFLVQPRESIMALLKSNYAISNSNMTFQKELWKRAGGFSETIKTHADLDFMMRVARHTPVTIVNDVILEYRIQASSLNRKDRTLAHGEWMLICREAVLQNPDRLGDVFWACYWRERAAAAEALRQWRVPAALRAYWRLVRTGAVFHHLWLLPRIRARMRKTSNN